MTHDRGYGIADPLRKILSRRRRPPRKHELERIGKGLQSRGFMWSQHAALQRMNEAATPGVRNPVVIVGAGLFQSSRP